MRSLLDETLSEGLIEPLITAVSSRLILMAVLVVVLIERTAGMGSRSAPRRPLAPPRRERLARALTH